MIRKIVKSLLLILSISVAASNYFMLPTPVFIAAESQTELSRREQEGEQVFTEEELAEYIVERSGNQSLEPELIYTIEEIEQFFDEVFIPLTEGEDVSETDLLEAAPEPSRHIELGTDNRYTWLAVGELEVITVEAHTAENGDIINLAKTHQTPKIYLPLLMKEDELLEMKDSSGTVDELVSLLGKPERTSLRLDSPPVYYWNVLGGSEIPAGDIVELEVTANADGEIQDVNYRIYE